MTLEEQFDSLDAVTIQTYVEEGQQEHVQLEFKTLNSPGFNRDDKKNLAELLSGFANSQGGIIIWGVDARRDNQGVDRAVLRRLARWRRRVPWGEGG